MKAINKISSVAMGFDSIPIDFLKIIGAIIAPILSHIFSVSLELGVYPTQWKKSIVLPLNKVENPESLNDFVP